MKIAVLGSGSWGTALALVANRAQHEIVIYSRSNEVCQQINLKQENVSYLSNIILPKTITATNELADIIDMDILIIAIPAQNIRNLCIDLKKLNLPDNKILLICSKGIEQKSLNLMSETVKEILPMTQVAVLSGPNFAREVAMDLPTITTIASSDIKLSEMLAKSLSNINFRIYPSDDVIAVQIIGAAKNVLAIATGITIGKKLGENAKASIISRGVFEINALSLAMGGRYDAILSPAGLGDIHLTCSSSTSRNTSMGIAIAQGTVANNALAEGFYSAESINALAKKLNIEMPICSAIYKIMYEKFDVDFIINELLRRDIPT